MEKEKVLEIKIIKINDNYSVFYPVKMNVKALEKVGFFVTVFDVLDEVRKPAISFYFNKENDFNILLDETSLNVPFIIENIYIEELKRTVDEYNEKYGIPKRWRAEEGGIYWFIDSDFTGKVRDLWDRRSTDENVRYNLGNYFKTKEEAEKVKEELDKFWERVRAGEIGGDE